MKTNDIIILDNNEKFTLLASTVKDNETYFLAGALDENDNFNPKKVHIVKAVYENDEKFIEVVEDEKLIKELSVTLGESLKN